MEKEGPEIEILKSQAIQFIRDLRKEGKDDEIEALTQVLTKQFGSVRHISELKSNNNQEIGGES